MAEKTTLQDGAAPEEPAGARLPGPGPSPDRARPQRRDLDVVGHRAGPAPRSRAVPV